MQHAMRAHAPQPNKPQTQTRIHTHTCVHPVQATSGRQELVIPVSSKYTGLSMSLLSQLVQALVGSSGGVSAPGGPGLTLGTGDDGHQSSRGPGLPSGCSPSAVLLAIVDDDNSVSLVRCFNYVQPPLEGPEAGEEEELWEEEEGLGEEEPETLKP
jgi:hypothetical protein